MSKSEVWYSHVRILPVWLLVDSFLYQNLLIFQAIADVIRTCLGPRSMLKMLMDPMGGIVMTNDGNAILREVHKFSFLC